MFSLFNFRKRKFTEMMCPICGVKCDVPTPPGVSKVEFVCGNAVCRRQQLIKPYIPIEEDALYFVTMSKRGLKLNLKLGSDSDPFSLEMYQRLGIAHTATSEEILDAYERRHLALNPPVGPNLAVEAVQNNGAVQNAEAVAVQIEAVQNAENVQTEAVQNPVAVQTVAVQTVAVQTVAVQTEAVPNAEAVGNAEAVANAEAVQNAGAVQDAEAVRVEEAFRILSDPTTRRNYNKFGLTADLVIPEEEGFGDLVNVLNHILGGGNFKHIIGEPVTLPRNLEANFDRYRLPLNYQEQQMAMVLDDNREEIQLFHVVDTLDQKLRRYDPDNEDDFRNDITMEAVDLRRHRNGVKLLHAVGNIYFIVGTILATAFSDSYRIYILLSCYRFIWQMIFHSLKYDLQTVRIMADLNYAADEEQDYFTKRWRTVSRHQQLRESYLRVLHDKYWLNCKMELEKRILIACFILFGEEIDIVGDGPVGRLQLVRKASALRIIGEIYQSQL